MNANAKPTVMIVDDESKIRDLVGEILAKSGFTVVKASGGPQALAMIESESVDLFLVDINMEEMDGYELCTAIHKDRVLAYTPIIFLTGYDTEKNKARAFSMGAADFLSKPVNPDELRTVVLKHLKTKIQWEEIKKDETVRQEPPSMLSFTGFKKYLAKKYSLDEGTMESLQEICQEQLTEASDLLGIPHQSLIKEIADYAHLDYVPEVHPEKIQLGILPMTFCSENSVVPIMDDAGKKVLVLSNPFNHDLLDILRRRFEKNYFRFGITDEGMIRDVFQSNELMQKESIYEKAKKAEETVLVPIHEQTGGEDDENDPVYVITENILESAVNQRASDIHMEPKVDEVVVRYRIDGDMKDVFNLKKLTGKRVLSRFKVLSELDIAQSRKPQDGAFAHKIKGRDFKLRVATTSTPNGESMIIRLLEPTASPKSLNELGMTEDQVTKLRHAANRNHGSIIIVGTTGSGKTTTIYSLLFGIDCKARSLVSVEDPVEYRIPLANQQQVNEKAGITFESVLKSAMRQDPDILYLGEIRDPFSAKAAVDFASTGHLTITTLHTSNTTTAVFRLERLGIERSSMADTLIAVVAQKLIRKLCPHCKKIETPTAQELETLSPYLSTPLKKVARPVGCAKCDSSGFFGREGVYEVLTFDPVMAKRVREGEAIAGIRAFSRNRGDFLISHHGVQKVQELLFTPEDVYEKVIAEEPPLDVIRAEPNQKTQVDAAVSQTAETADVPASSSSNDSAEVSILVVDDEEDMRLLIQRYLEKAGYTVTLAEDGISALMEMGKCNYDLIISDLNMPNLDGFRLLEMKNQKGIEAPVLFLTAESEQESEAQALEMGAVDYIKKPIQKGILINRVKNALGTARRGENV